MTAAQLITALQAYPGTATVFVMAADWNPKAQQQVSSVMDAGGQTKPTTPLLMFRAGPLAYRSFDQSGQQNV